MPSLRHKRGTRTQITAAATANQLQVGEVYLITDEARLTVGTAANAHQAMAKQGEAGAAPDVRQSPVLVTDFTHKNFVQNGFLGAFIASGTSGSAIPGTENHPGLWLVRSSTTANSGARCMTEPSDIRISGGEIFDFVFSTRASFSGLMMRAGLIDTNSAADAIDGAYFELGATGAIVGKTSSNSVRSTTAPIATLAVDTFYHLRLTVNAGATLVTFEVFSDAGTLLGSQTLATNIPTAPGRETGCGFVATNSGIVAADLIAADFMQFKTTRTLVRGALN